MSRQINNTKHNSSSPSRQAGGDLHQYPIQPQLNLSATRVDFEPLVIVSAMTAYDELLAVYIEFIMFGYNTASIEPNKHK